MLLLQQPKIGSLSGATEYNYWMPLYQEICAKLGDTLAAENYRTEQN